MIVQPPIPWYQMLFSVRNSSLRRTTPRIAAVTAVAVVVTAAELYFRVETYSLTVTPFTLIGLALSIFLGFRNNAAYDRFWEARKLWGQLVNSSRSFARQVLVFLRPSESWQADDQAVRSLQVDLIKRQIAYVHALRHHLRGSEPFADLARFLSEEDLRQLRDQKNVPIAILQETGLRLRAAWMQGLLTEFHLSALEDCLTTITDVQGACERIRNTPIPFGYTVLIHRLVAFYCFFLPFGIVQSVGWLTPLVVALISHAFFGLDEIGGAIEEPFGTEPQHLPLAALCRTIEINLLQAAGEEEVPPFLQPVHGVLL
jgi:putative membrane protein